MKIFEQLVSNGVPFNNFQEMKRIRGKGRGTMIQGRAFIQSIINETRSL